MPLYVYQCLYCGNGESQLASCDDHMTLCAKCGNLMLRLDESLFWQFFEATLETDPVGWF